MNHEIPRKPRVDVRKPVTNDVELHELDAGIFAAVLGDEIRHDIRTDIAKAGRPLHVSHPMKVATWRIEQGADRLASHEFRKLRPDRHRPLQFGAPAATALAIVPPVLPE